MENASKALIIAGAILLAILIISLGIMIYNQASGVVNNNSMDEVEVATYNKKFTQYEGNYVKGAQVNALLQQIVQHNLANRDDSSRQVWICGTVSTSDPASWSGTIHWDATKQVAPLKTGDAGKALLGTTYNVKCKKNSEAGFVTLVTINANV